MIVNDEGSPMLGTLRMRGEKPKYSYTAAEISELLGVSIRRIYEDTARGLLEPEDKTVAKNKRYQISVVDRWYMDCVRGGRS